MPDPAKRDVLPDRMERRVYVCDIHGETKNVVGMGGKGEPPWCVECRKPVEIVVLVPAAALVSFRAALTEIRDACEPGDPIFMAAAAALAGPIDEIGASDV